MRIEYTNPTSATRVQRVSGQPSRRRPSEPRRSLPTQTRSGETYWIERRRVELAAERRARPDFSVYGCVVPYGVPLDDGRGNRLVFTPDTDWLIGSPPFVPIEVEHGGGMVGMASVVEERSGLVIGDSTIYGACRQTVDDRQHLSVGLGEYHCRERADGVLEVTDAELREISMVRVPRWPEHCAAHVVQKAAV